MTTMLRVTEMTDEQLGRWSDRAERVIGRSMGRNETRWAHDVSKAVHAEFQRRHNARRESDELADQMETMKDAAGEALDSIRMALAHIATWRDNAAGSTRFDHLPAEARDELRVASNALDDLFRGERRR